MATMFVCRGCGKEGGPCILGVQYNDDDRGTPATPTDCPYNTWQKKNNLELSVLRWKPL